MIKVAVIKRLSFLPLLIIFVSFAFTDNTSANAQAAQSFDVPKRPARLVINDPCKRLKQNNADIPRFAEVALSDLGKNLLSCAKLYNFEDPLSGDVTSDAGEAYAGRLAMIAGDVFARLAAYHKKNYLREDETLSWAHAVEAYGIATSHRVPGAERLYEDALKRIPEAKD